MYIEDLILGSAYRYFWTLTGSRFRWVALGSTEFRQSPNATNSDQIALRTDLKTDIN